MSFLPEVYIPSKFLMNGGTAKTACLRILNEVESN